MIIYSKAWLKYTYTVYLNYAVKYTIILKQYLIFRKFLL